MRLPFTWTAVPGCLLLAGRLAAAQTAPCPEPAALPPAGSPPLYRCAELVFHPENVTLVDGPTYQRFLRTAWSRPSEGLWVPYDEKALQTDFWSLWRSGFLDNLWIEVFDEPYANGVMGKHVVFHLEERPRVRVVEYEGSRRVNVSDIEKALREANLAVRLDTFVDRTVIRQASGVIREMYAEQGYHAARVTPALEPLPEAGRRVRLTFTIDEGPKYRLDEVVFDGNSGIGDRTLAGRLRRNRPRTWLSFLTGTGRLRLDEFADDAQRVVDYYADRGFVKARVGAEQIDVIRDSHDGRTRHVRLRIPVDEGVRYRVGAFEIAGSTVVPPDALRKLFDVEIGDYYSRKKIDEAITKARDMYGAAGFIEFLPTPEFTFRNDEATAAAAAAPEVDVTMRISEGAQYRVNRITFEGNTMTRDHVIRREIRVAEQGVFNSQALKDSLRRLNQLGYFEPLEADTALDVQPTPGKSDAVDVVIKVKEQNRNQFNFGAGASQYDGLFASLSFSTSNFLGRGETLSAAFQRGQRATNNQVAFTEPYLFDRPVTAGLELFSRKTDYEVGGALGYSEVRSGFTTITGLAVAAFTRAYLGYSYERIETAVRNDLLGSTVQAAGSVASVFLDEGRETESRISPSLTYSTVNHPIFPRSGIRATASLDLAGGRLLGGTTSYVKSNAEFVIYVPHTARTAFGVRGQSGWVRPFGETEALPYYQRFYLGGEYQIRGVDIRSVGPIDDQNRIIGGTRYLLFNAEYYFDLFGAARLVAFHDAGQAFAEDEPINLRRLRSSSGAELRVMLPVLNVPMRLIYAWNLYRDSFQPPRAFKVAVGTTF